MFPFGGFGSAGRIEAEASRLAPIRNISPQYDIQIHRTHDVIDPLFGLDLPLVVLYLEVAGTA